MPFSGGVASALINFASLAATPPIPIGQLDSEIADIMTMFDNCILRDGTGLPAATIPFNNQAITGLASLQINSGVATGALVVGGTSAVDASSALANLIFAGDSHTAWNDTADSTEAICGAYSGGGYVGTYTQNVFYIRVGNIPRIAVIPGGVAGGQFSFDASAASSGYTLQSILTDTYANIWTNSASRGIRLGINGVAKITLDTSGAVTLAATLGINGASPPAQITGWGTPVGFAVINNYNITDAGGANSNTNKAVAQIIHDLKALGLYGA